MKRTPIVGRPQIKSTQEPTQVGETGKKTAGSEDFIESVFPPGNFRIFSR